MYRYRSPVGVVHAWTMLVIGSSSCRPRLSSVVSSTAELPFWSVVSCYIPYSLYARYGGRRDLPRDLHRENRDNARRIHNTAGGGRPTLELRPATSTMLVFQLYNTSIIRCIVTKVVGRTGLQRCTYQPSCGHAYRTAVRPSTLHPFGDRTTRRNYTATIQL